jgi:hypothetical protein
MDSAPGVDGHRNVARDRVNVIEIPNVRTGPAIISAHGNNGQALRLLSTKGEGRSLYTGFGASQIRAGPQRIIGCSFVCDPSKRVVGEWIGYSEFLIDGEPDNPRKRQFVLFELIGCVCQPLFGRLSLHLRP